MAISQERSLSLQQQLDEVKVKEEPTIEIKEDEMQSLSMGPPQPQSPPLQDEPTDGPSSDEPTDESAVEPSSDEFEKLRVELAETKQLNT